MRFPVGHHSSPDMLRLISAVARERCMRAVVGHCARRIRLITQSRATSQSVLFFNPSQKSRMHSILGQRRPSDEPRTAASNPQSTVPVMTRRLDLILSFRGQNLAIHREKLPTTLESFGVDSDKCKAGFGKGQSRNRFNFFVKGRSDRYVINLFLRHV